MTTEHSETESGITVPLTQEERLREIAEATLRRCGDTAVFPIVSDWPEGPLQVFVSPAEMAAEHMPKTALAFVEFEHEGKPFVASLGAND